MKKQYWFIYACSFLNVSYSATLNLSQYPLFLNSGVTPNIMIIYDNSQSMDGTMAGKLISGNQAETRGNIAKSVIRSIVTNYRTQFNWGLEIFGTSGTPNRYNTYAYYLGDSSTMKFTNDCVGGISATNSGLRCTSNPQNNNSYLYITYDATGDDPNINDVLYTGYSGTGMWGIKPSGTSGTGTSYSLFNNHAAVSTWNLSSNSTGSPDFSSASFGSNPVTFSTTDAGFLPSWPTYTRQFYLPRGWGYGNNITGLGKVVEAIKADSTTHYNTLMSLLASETNSTSSSEIKNNALYTPLTGSLSTARSYFSGTLSGFTSPIQYSCQKNFVLLATDGNPTGKTDGTQYNSSAWQNSDTGQAYLDVYAQIQSLRNTTVSSINYNIETYIVGLGDTVANPTSVAGLNKMAVYGGTDKAYFANDSASLMSAFQSIAADIVARTAAASSVSLNTGSWNTGADLFQAKFNSGDWSGQLLSYFISANGDLGSLRWDASLILNTQSWNSGRTILTYKPSAALGARGIPFRWPASPSSPSATEMDVTQSTWLNKNSTGTVDGYGSLKLNYLRGSDSNESNTCPSCTPLFRNRPTSKLGDIINSAPYYVGSPSFGYPAGMESSAYSSFSNANTSRTPVIYVGGNDGMLHGFNANTGREILAYIPSSVYKNLSALTETSYGHKYYVDGSPTVGDVFYGGSWKTLLVGGLRAGGQGLFALNITNPSIFSESNANSIVRWEFSDSNDADLGNTFAQPLLVKTNNGRWSVIIGNGYNSTISDGNTSTTGRAFLFVLDAETGAVTAKIDTNTGNTTTPNGLSGGIAIDTNGDSIVDTVYAGDLYGKLWKFDLSSTSPSSWGVAFSGAPLISTGQPITMKPDVTVSPQGGYLVLFGTGQYMDTADPSTTGTRAFYGIWDNNTAISSLSSLQSQSVVGTATGPDGNSYRISTFAVGTPSDTLLSGDNQITVPNYYLNKKGWYINLPSTGERAVADPNIRGGRIIFNTLIPNSTVCSYGGSGWVMELDVNTGNRLVKPTFDINNDKNLTNSDYINYSSGTNNTTGRYVTSIPAQSGFMRPPQKPGSAPFENKYINTSSGVISIVGETSGNTVQGRVMWQQVP